jgi:Protein of unknown function (DUF3822)
MPFLELFDETLDINSTENYEISVELSHHSLSFFILDTIRNKFIMMRSFKPDNNRIYSVEDINDIINKDDFLTKKYKKVNLIVPSSRFTIVPSPLFDPARKNDYYSFNHVSSDNDIILNNKLIDPDSFLVFDVSQPINDLIKSRWPGVLPFHHLKPLLDDVCKPAKNSPDPYIHIYVEVDFFNIILYEHSALKFCNSFNYRNISDILYYIMNIVKSMDIKQEETIYLSGQTERYDDLYSNLAMYIRNVKFAEPTGNFTFSYVFNDSSLHKYINLISVVNCA